MDRNMYRVANVCCNRMSVRSSREISHI